MAEMFLDVIPDDRSKRFLLSLSEAERDYLRNKAQELGVHISVLIRRALKVALIDKPDLFNLFS